MVTVIGMVMRRAMAFFEDMNCEDTLSVRLRAAQLIDIDELHLTSVVPPELLKWLPELVLVVD